MPTVSPYILKGSRTSMLAVWVLVALYVPVSVYSALYNPPYAAWFTGYVVIGLLLDALYHFLRDGTFHVKSLGSGVSAALLAASLPPTMPFLPMLFALIVSIVLVKLPGRGSPLRFNAAMAGRLFLMLAYSEATTDRGAPYWPNVISCATPLELYQNEGAALPLHQLLWGRLGGTWEDLFQIVPASPGETMPALILLLGIILFVKGIIPWRTPLAFLIAYLTGISLLGEAPHYHLFTGATLFSAIFILTDPVSTPMSKIGQTLTGVLVGIITALLQHFTYYTETIVFAVLLGNLFAPLLDRMAFVAQSRRIQRRIPTPRQETA